MTGCELARGPDADWHRNTLIYFAAEGLDARLIVILQPMGPIVFDVSDQHFLCGPPGRALQAGPVSY